VSALSFDAPETAEEVAPPVPIVIKKITVVHPHGHHGGAWKVAYADFVTAMMAFFLLLWIVGATNEDQRKGIADYFTPTVIQQQGSGGSNGVLAGRSIQSPDGVQPNPAQSKKGVVDPVVTTGSFGRKEGPGATGKSTREGLGPAKSAREMAMETDEANFQAIARALAARLETDAGLGGVKQQVRFVKTRDGLRIDIVDRAKLSMFRLGTDELVPEADRLVRAVAESLEAVPNRLAIRGHTDALGYASAGGMNNWILSTQRAEATRRTLAAAGIDARRFARIEGVADGEPFNPADPLDPRNRRISVTVLWQGP
jgi:chemotaxis protein MotB